MPLIATNCIRNEALYPTYDNVRYVSPETYATWFRGHPKPGDILFVNKGTPGRVCMVPDPVDFCIAQDMVSLRADAKVVYPPFLFAVLRSPGVQDSIDRMHVGTMIPHFKKGDFDKLLLPIPRNRKVQEFIGDCYLNLSLKIEVNRKTARVLEGIARAVFTSWFVDFDPVRANIRRREHAAASSTPPRPRPARPTPPKGRSISTGDDRTLHDAATNPADQAAREAAHAAIAHLFPDRLADSPLGEVPDGWRVAELTEIVEVIDCLHTKKPDRTESGRLLLQLANIRDDGLLDPSDEYLISEDDYRRWSAKFETRKGDCVITNVGRVGAVSQVPEGVQAALGRNMTGLRPRADFSYPTFLIHALLSDRMRSEIVLKTDSGTILDALNVRSIGKLRVVVPGGPLLQLFEARFRPLRARVEHTLRESANLAALRDTLLPKLISGELRIADAEKIVGRAIHG